MALQIHDGKRYAEPLISLQNRYRASWKGTLGLKLVQLGTEGFSVCGIMKDVKCMGNINTIILKYRQRIHRKIIAYF